MGAGRCNFHSMNKDGTVFAAQGAVASSQPLASEIGLEILKQGGTAVDAAIAVNAALGLVEPHMCGIGGDLFAIAWDAAGGQLHGFNASGRSPRNLSHEQLQSELSNQGIQQIPIHGTLSLSVPGAVDGWYCLHERFGRLPMAELLAPAIHYARHGFDVTPVIAGEWQQFSALLDDKQPGDFSKTYRPGNNAPGAGTSFRNPDLAASYSAIASGGAEAFYRGEMARVISTFLKDNGGHLSMQDFSEHRSDWVDTLSVSYRGYEVHELPPNSQGLAALQMFRMLEDRDLSAMASADLVHYMVETKKLAFEDRARFYADMDFADIPIEHLLSETYSRQRASLIQDAAAMTVEAGQAQPRSSDTVYLTCADREGNMVSLIQSIFHPFGSGVVVPGTGFALQNRGMLFSMDSRHANAYAPGKRPFQTIIPAFLTRDGKPVMSFGVMGGDMQPQGHVQVISHIIDRGMSLQQAGDQPRWRHDGSSQPTGSSEDVLSDGGGLVLESGFPEEVVEVLEKRGHRLTDDDMGFGFGGYQAIRRSEEGGYEAATESRKDGVALGY